MRFVALLFAAMAVTFAVADEPMCQGNCQAFSDQAPPDVEVLAIEPVRPVVALASVPVRVAQRAVQVVQAQPVRNVAVALYQPVAQRVANVRTRKPVRRLFARLRGRLGCCR